MPDRNREATRNEDFFRRTERSPDESRPSARRPPDSSVDCAPEPMEGSRSAVKVPGRITGGGASVTTFSAWSFCRCT